MSSIIELPRYQCHKQVWALKINRIIPSPRGHLLGFENQRYAPHEVSDEWMNKHHPEIGGYYVVYEGGYTSWSPADVFEHGYSPIEAGSETYQGRVMAEQQELDSKIAKLTEFTNSALFATLEQTECNRLARQLAAMTEYSDILGQRIAAFQVAEGV